MINDLRDIIAVIGHEIMDKYCGLGFGLIRVNEDFVVVCADELGKSLDCGLFYFGV